jgi:hypothetical protein
MKSKNIKLIINGREIPDLSKYSYFDVKSFFKEPKRSTKGVIFNLNGYSTFLTPRIKFEFKYMPIEAYRVLMKLIKEFNEFIVEAYDPVENEYVVKRMYFKTKDFPEIFSKGLETLAVLNESFELVGTNASVDAVSIVYNKNDGSAITSGLVSTYGSMVVIGDYTSTVTSEDPRTWSRANYKMVMWNTESDGTGTSYGTNMTIQISKDIILYAIWEAVSES